MINEEKDLATRVAEKEAEIERYIGILDRAHPGRWYHTGVDRLAFLRKELVELQNQLNPEE